MATINRHPAQAPSPLPPFAARAPATAARQVDVLRVMPRPAHEADVRFLREGGSGRAWLPPQASSRFQPVPPAFTSSPRPAKHGRARDPDDAAEALTDLPSKRRCFAVPAPPPPSPVLDTLPSDPLPSPPLLATALEPFIDAPADAFLWPTFGEMGLEPQYQVVLPPQQKRAGGTAVEANDDTYVLSGAVW